jgi:hypothetical protein
MMFRTASALALLCILGFASAAPRSARQEGTVNRYIGADKCKNCHQSDAAGNPYAHWQKAGHSRAFEVLASDAAMAAAKARGIEEPQKDGRCLKCHVTALGVPAEALKKGFDATKGVQCETCHGPGEQHMKARFAAAAQGGAEPGAVQAIPAGEIVAKVDEQTCRACHNEESPTYKPFCFKERLAAIAHFDPRKPRPAEERVSCSCPKCTAEAGGK